MLMQTRSIKSLGFYERVDSQKNLQTPGLAELKTAEGQGVRQSYCISYVLEVGAIATDCVMKASQGWNAAVLVNGKMPMKKSCIKR